MVFEKIIALNSFTALHILRIHWEMLPAKFAEMGNHLDWVVEGDDAEVLEPHAIKLKDGEMMDLLNSEDLDLLNSEDCRRICTAWWGGTFWEIPFQGCGIHPDAASFTKV